MERLLGFDPQLLFGSFVTGVNVFILFFALSYMLFNPVREVLEKRKQKIAGELKSAADDMEAAHAMKEEYELKLHEVKKEAEAILEDARKRAKQREAEIIAEARDEANRIVMRGNREVELERKKALDDMKEQIISIASVMAGKVVAASIDTTVQDALIDETLKEMGESTWQS
ncbi:F0F1 ATP synthase subunit B [Clostridium sp. Marseille-P2415]|uniref:F0F1 ATP synthase subunit B n=1 Tax=Clostridium sp. Marseille-P2415 TaxID=1805471 RepID=UPI0009885597|nr:F0F1 ATP synthase subunit B [Clostridium sp. Marseille-P2415]